MGQETDTAAKILRFHQECLRPLPPVAPFDLIGDSQTQLVLQAIAGHKSPRILDYGCGNLRLLHALLASDAVANWTYVGADVMDPALGDSGVPQVLAALPGRDQWSTCNINALRRLDTRFDVGVLMNVLHELPLEAIAAALQDFRLRLDDGGVLVVVDTVFVPEGEPRFVPFYPWEIGFIAPGAASESYRSKSGIPINFYTIHRSSIPSYYGLSRILAGMFHQKRDAWSHLSARLSNEDRPNALHELGLGKSREFDYAYLNAIIANASYRLSEFTLATRYEGTAVNQASVDIMTLVEDMFETDGLPTVHDLFEKLGSKHTYQRLEAALDALQGVGFHGVILPIVDPSRVVHPTTAWDALQDRLGTTCVLERGIAWAVSEAVAIILGERHP